MSAKHLAPNPRDVPIYASPGATPAGQYRDLCSTCDHVKACGGRSTPERPTFYCEQFEVFAPASVPEVRRVTPGRPRSKNGLGAGAGKGLCSNCENADTCTAPDSEGGVWHCEEYR
jgi:hypothetical protein